MARIVAFVPDLLFGSNVAGMLGAAGHDVQLVSVLEPPAVEHADLVVVDLTADSDARIAAARPALTADAPTLAFYSHVEPDVRDRAQDAGFDLVVPRSRMNREGAALAGQLLDRR